MITVGDKVTFDTKDFEQAMYDIAYKDKILAVTTIKKLFNSGLKEANDYMNQIVINVCK